MYETIQNILTYSIEAIAILGFCACCIHYTVKTTLIEIASWGIPQPISEYAEKNEMNNEFLDSMSELESAATTHNIFICDNSPSSDTKQPETQAPTFQNYTRNRLRKIARELGVRGFSKMEIPDLITAIASHPEAQRVCPS